MCSKRVPDDADGVRSILRPVVVAYSIRSRRRKAKLILEFAKTHHLTTVIFAGVRGRGSKNEMVLEEMIADYTTVLAAFDLVTATPPWPYVIADGRAMPFADQCCQVVISNAVIEHVGNEDDQRRFVREHLRVGSSAIITTPNRWFPVESHTSTILRHWAPSWRRKHSTEFSRLLSRREFAELLPSHAVVVGGILSPTFTAFVCDCHGS